ncbi:hypothetical protein [Ornithinimicrobium kibberense]|uniref:hypothetical protein n=1 Tax=Ornithinimicrobium kibberense TaxID=282060 RepID=UPI00360B8610
MDPVEQLGLGHGLGVQLLPLGGVHLQTGGEGLHHLPQAALGVDRAPHELGLQQRRHRGALRQAPVELEPSQLLPDRGGQLPVAQGVQAQLLDEPVDPVPLLVELSGEPGELAGDRQVRVILGHPVRPVPPAGGAGQVVVEVELEHGSVQPGLLGGQWHGILLVRGTSV